MFCQFYYCCKFCNILTGKITTLQFFTPYWKKFNAKHTKKTGNGQNVGYDMAKMAANSVYQKTGVKPSDVQVIFHINWYGIKLI